MSHHIQRNPLSTERRFQVSAFVERPLKRQIKKAAKKSGVTISVFVGKAIEAALNTSKAA